MIDCKADCRWVERCDAASAFKYHRKSCPVYGEKEHRTQTNADRIRSMTDEELAYFIANDYYVPHCPVDGECLDDHDGCDGCWLVWLKQESGDSDV